MTQKQLTDWINKKFSNTSHAAKELGMCRQGLTLVLNQDFVTVRMIKRVIRYEVVQRGIDIDAILESLPTKNHDTFEFFMNDISRVTDFDIEKAVSDCSRFLEIIDRRKQTR